MPIMPYSPTRTFKPPSPPQSASQPPPSPLLSYVSPNPYSQPQIFTSVQFLHCSFLPWKLTSAGGTDIFQVSQQVDRGLGMLSTRGSCWTRSRATCRRPPPLLSFLNYRQLFLVLFPRQQRKGREEERERPPLVLGISARTYVPQFRAKRNNKIGFTLLC